MDSLQKRLCALEKAVFVNNAPKSGCTNSKPSHSTQIGRFSIRDKPSRFTVSNRKPRKFTVRSRNS